MKKVFIVVSILSVLLVSGKAFAFGGCESDCRKCHSLEKSEVQGILKKLHVSEAKVLDIKMSPLKGLWQVTVDEKGKRDSLLKLGNELNIFRQMVEVMFGLF